MHKSMQILSRLWVPTIPPTLTSKSKVSLIFPRTSHTLAITFIHIRFRMRRIPKTPPTRHPLFRAHPLA
jgi:hypothetical protein